jgi:predicted dinucleotide-binding enzyme
LSQPICFDLEKRLENEILALKNINYFPMQTILGAGEAIGIELAKALPQYTTDIRLVSRTPKAINATDQLHPADLTDAAQIDRAVAGSEICYLTVGFDYIPHTG